MRYKKTYKIKTIRLSVAELLPTLKPDYKQSIAEQKNEEHQKRAWKK